MQIQYFTQKGSVYACQNDATGKQWSKKDRNGVLLLLAGGIHLTRKRLQELISEYPTSALDTTVCFGDSLAKEFFDDAKREHLDKIPDGQETHIFFLLKKGDGKYSLGYSSPIQKIEKLES